MRFDRSFSTGMEEANASVSLSSITNHHFKKSTTSPTETTALARLSLDGSQHRPKRKSDPHSSSESKRIPSRPSPATSGPSSLTRPINVEGAGLPTPQPPLRRSASTSGRVGMETKLLLGGVASARSHRESTDCCRTPTTAFPSLMPTFVNSRKEKPRRVHIVWPPDVCDVSWTDDKELSFMVPFSTERSSFDRSFTNNNNSSLSVNPSSGGLSRNLVDFPPEGSATAFNLSPSCSRGPNVFQEDGRQLSDSQMSFNSPTSLKRTPRHRYNPHVDDIRSCLKGKSMMSMCSQPDETSRSHLSVPMNPDTAKEQNSPLEKELSGESFNSPWCSWMVNQSLKDLSAYV